MFELFTTPPVSLSRQDLWIALWIMILIASIEAGLLGGMASNVGGFRRLMRLTAKRHFDRANKTNQKTSQTPPNPKNKKRFENRV